jgi:non-ribosomal peptide synthetase component F
VSHAAGEPEGRKRTRVFARELTERVEQLAVRAGASLFMVQLAAFIAVLHQRTGSPDIVLGAASTVRDRPELQGLIGCFVTSLVLRVEFDPSDAFSDVLDEVRHTCREAAEHGDVPFGELVRQLRPARESDPLYAIRFVHHDDTAEPARLRDGTLQPLGWQNGTAKFDLLCSSGRLGEDTFCTIEYRTGLYLQGTIDRLLQSYELVLDETTRRPRITLADLNRVIAEADRRARDQSLAQLRPKTFGLLGRTVRKPVAAAAGAHAAKELTP